MDKTLKFLQTVDIFSMLDKDELEKVHKYLHLVNLDKNQVLLRQGDEGEELYIIKSGIITGSIELKNGQQKELAEFSQGNFFGEMAIFENAVRSATCTAKEKSALFQFHKHDFFRLLKNSPEIAIKIMYRMLHITTKRLHNTSEFVSEIVQWGNEARKRAITDELTGVYNRRFLDEAIEDYFTASKNRKKPLSLCMVDLDYFREINEKYDHETGDQVILGVVTVFKKHLRKKDIIARYGGDEFSVLFPETPLEKARTICESIRQDVEKLDILSKKKGGIKKVTTSQGVASFPENAQNVKTLRKKADDALYKAKESGRNRVTCAK